jgi:hypothetical protein
MTETNYRWNGITLPAVKKRSIDNYVENGDDPGHFLGSCLANDLQGAYGHADSWGLTLIPVIVKYIYNRIPQVCWGDWDTVKNWQGMDHYKKQLKEAS